MISHLTRPQGEVQEPPQEILTTWINFNRRETYSFPKAFKNLLPNFQQIYEKFKKKQQNKKP
jgi:hypothetical protein